MVQCQALQEQPEQTCLLPEGVTEMTETYSINKTISKLDIDISITVADRELLMKLDDTIREEILKHYGAIKHE